MKSRILDLFFISCAVLDIYLYSLKTQFLSPLEKMFSAGKHFEAQSFSAGNEILIKLLEGRRHALYVGHVGLSPWILWELWLLSQPGQWVIGCLPLKHPKSRTYHLGCSPEIRNASVASAMSIVDTGPLQAAATATATVSGDETVLSPYFLPAENSIQAGHCLPPSFCLLNLAWVQPLHEIYLTSGTPSCKGVRKWILSFLASSKQEATLKKVEIDAE